MPQPLSVNSIKAILERVSVRNIDEATEGDQDLFSSLVLDSYSLIEFMLALEEAFEIVIDPADVGREHFSTIEDIVKLLVAKYISPPS